MRRKGEPDGWTSLAIVALVGLVALAGCLGVGERDVSESVEAQGADEVEPSEATQALWEEGHKDPYLDTEPTGNVVEYDFYVDEQNVITPYGDQQIWTFAFQNGEDGESTVPGPEIRVQQGDTVRVNLHVPSSDFPGHTMHWHGIDVPWRSDGVPWVTQEIADAGENHTYTYEFVAKQAGTYWYHCVTAFPVDVDVGLFGPLVIEPSEGPELPYDREETLMFHEMDSQWLQATGWAINDNHDPDPTNLPENPVDTVDTAKHQLRSNLGVAGLVAGNATGEYLFEEGPRDYYPTPSPRYKPVYDTFMIDGKSYPETQPFEISEGETLRLRLINAGQLHKSIHLHGHHVLVTHNDGYPLEEPRWEDTINLAPGERKDVYVQGTNPGIWKLHDHSGGNQMGTTNANDYAFPGGMITAMVYEGFTPPEGLPAGDTHQNTAGDYAVHAYGGN